MSVTVIIPVLSRLEGEDASAYPAAWVRCRIGGKSLLERAAQTARELGGGRVVVVSDLPDARREAKRLGVDFMHAPAGWDHSGSAPLSLPALGLRGAVVLLNPRAALVDAGQLRVMAASLTNASAIEVLVPVRQHPVGTFQPTPACTMNYSRTIDSDRWRELEELRLWHFPRMARGVNVDATGPTVWLLGDEVSCLTIRSPLDARVAEAWLASPGVGTSWRPLGADVQGVTL